MPFEINPLMALGAGMLANNRGATSGQAFGNAIGGGFQAMLQAQQAQHKQKMQDLQTKMLEWQMDQMQQEEQRRRQAAEQMAPMMAGVLGGTSMLPAPTVPGLGGPAPSPYDALGGPQAYGMGEMPGSMQGSSAAMPGGDINPMQQMQGYQHPLTPQVDPEALARYEQLLLGPYGDAFAKQLIKQQFPEAPQMPSAGVLAQAAYPDLPLAESLSKLYAAQNAGKGTTVNVGPQFDPKTAPAKELFDRLQLVQTFGEGSPQVREYDRRTAEEAAPTAEQAGRRAMIGGMSKVLPQIADAVMPLNPLTGKREIDRVLIANMNVGTPFTEGRLARARLEDALQVKLRLETGAQANEAEVEKIMDRFLPSPLDSDELVRDKLGRLKLFSDTALEIADPELYRKLKERAKSQSSAPDDLNAVMEKYGN